MPRKDLQFDECTFSVLVEKLRTMFDPSEAGFKIDEQKLTVTVPFNVPIQLVLDLVRHELGESLSVGQLNTNNRILARTNRTDAKIEATQAFRDAGFIK
jgi:hypothetical protein